MQALNFNDQLGQVPMLRDSPNCTGQCNICTILAIKGDWNHSFEIGSQPTRGVSVSS